ncbi:MAG: FAD binding domain-containing protein [Lachnospiraceae bacterium]|jgi:xanthine dehydrogenase FAD-binding subunit
MMNGSFLHPHTMQELAEALGQMTEKSRIIAGGTDLMIVLRNKRPEVDMYVNIWGMEEIEGIREEEGWVRIGAATTHDTISKNPIIKEKFKALSMACGRVGSQQIRNKGTIGGSLVNASPAGDMIPCVCLFGGELEILKADGSTYRILAADFTLGVSKTALRPQEALTAIWLPIRENRHSAFVKLGSRKEVTIAQVNMAVSWEKDEYFHNIEGYLGAVDTKPVYLEELDRILANKKIEQKQREELVQSLRDRITAIREKRKRPPKLKITEAEQLYKERAVRSVVYDMIDLMEVE